MKKGWLIGGVIALLLIASAAFADDPTEPTAVKSAAPAKTQTAQTPAVEAVDTPAPAPTPEPAPAPAPAPAPTPTAASSANCEPNYDPCVPNVAYDLDCPDIGHSVRVVGSSDPYRLDGDHDGWGCESY